jgi:hypothetical protein
LRIALYDPWIHLPGGAERTILEEPDADTFAQRLAELDGDPIRAREISAACIVD